MVWNNERPESSVKFNGCFTFEPLGTPGGRLRRAILRANGRRPEAVLPGG